LVDAVPGIQTVYTGTPESSATRVMAYVAFLGADVQDKALGGLFRGRLRYFVGIGYRVEKAETAAETTMAQASTDFIMAFYANRNAHTLLGGTVDSMELIASQSSEPVYTTLNGREFRVVPHIVEVTQHQTVPVT